MPRSWHTTLFLKKCEVPQKIEKGMRGKTSRRQRPATLSHFVLIPATMSLAQQMRDQQNKASGLTDLCEALKQQPGNALYHSVLALVDEVTNNTISKYHDHTRPYVTAEDSLNKQQRYMDGTTALLEKVFALQSQVPADQETSIKILTILETGLRNALTFGKKVLQVKKKRLYEPETD